MEMAIKKQRSGLDYTHDIMTNYPFNTRYGACTSYVHPLFTEPARLSGAAKEPLPH